MVEDSTHHVSARAPTSSGSVFVTCTEGAFCLSLYCGVVMYGVVLCMLRCLHLSIPYNACGRVLWKPWSPDALHSMRILLTLHTSSEVHKEAHKTTPCWLPYLPKHEDSTPPACSKGRMSSVLFLTEAVRTPPSWMLGTHGLVVRAHCVCQLMPLMCSSSESTSYSPSALPSIPCQIQNCRDLPRTGPTQSMPPSPRCHGDIDGAQYPANVVLRLFLNAACATLCAHRAGQRSVN